MPISRPLIAIDLSEVSESAARWVAALVPADTEVVLGHAVDVPEPPSFLRSLFPQTAAIQAMAEQGARQELQSLAARIPLPRAVCDVREGRPADVMSQIATERSVDVIVLGPHGPRQGLGQFVSSTAVKLARSASTVPLVVVRGPNTDAPPEHILAAVDDSPVSFAALRWAALLAHATGAKLHVTTIVNPVLVNALGIAATDTERDTGLAQVKSVSAAWLSDVVAALPEPRPAITTSVHIGRPADAILDAATAVGADFIVVGRNSNALNTVLGSVADSILHNGTVSTAVISG